MRKRVLVVDDDEKIRRVLQQTMRMENFLVFAADSGKEAMLQFKREKPDLVILDLMMPGMDGFEVLREIRKTSNTPVIILSARDELTDKAAGFALGVDDYLAKPFSPAELVMRAKAVLRRAGETKADSQEVIAIGEVEINFTAHQLKVRGEDVRLTPSEFALLGILMKNAGRVLNREQLLSLLRTDDFPEDVNSVNVFLHRLRHKIEQNPSEPSYLLTVWGVGYTFAKK